MAVADATLASLERRMTSVEGRLASAEQKIIQLRDEFDVRMDALEGKIDEVLRILKRESHA